MGEATSRLSTSDSTDRPFEMRTGVEVQEGAMHLEAEHLHCQRQP